MWETGEALDESRIPGTRRLWLAGALLLSVLTATVTAVSLLENGTDSGSKDRTENTTSAANEPVLPDPPPAAPPTGKSGLASPESSDATPDGSSSPEAQQGDPEPDPAPRPSKPASSEKPPTKPPSSSSSMKSVQAVNYPGRFWHLGGDTVRLDPMSAGSSSGTRQDATFKLVPGLADADCHSFYVTDGRYLRHKDFQLRAELDNGSSLFEKDATFCPRPSAFSGAIMLEAVNYPGRFVRHRNFQLRLDPFQNSNLYRADSAFRLVKGLG
ncbi:AbfB domain-containing protein [Streptomyces sp. NPDC050704]|uniref:AbfB domain-containing protein n=1 Tax=Streptomyces sp. NPDC050704 TaxID=3157219 RepID=UPI0034238061